MHYFFAARRKSTSYFVLGGVVVTLFWPIAAISFFLIASSARAKGITDSLTEHDNATLDTLRIKIETLAFKHKDATSVFEFREVFSRYSGLTQASQVGTAETKTSEIFRLSQHANAQLATRCLNRNAAAHLLCHVDHARRDFIELASTIAQSENAKVLQLLTETAAVLGDDQTIGHLQRLDDGSRRTNSSDLKTPSQVGLNKFTHQ